MVTFSTLEPGAVFAGRYRIERRIKAGGMGAVYAVRHVRTNALLALKVMSPEIVADEGFRERFTQEAQIASLVDSPNVVQITDADVDAKTGLPFMVMELLRGRELGELLKERGRFSPEEVVAWLGQVGRALDKAHAANVIHRDLKPANLFLVTSEDEPARMKILDFGIAKIVSRATAATTHAGGTPLFMAPEQTGKSRRIGPWTDIWALGLIAYMLLVGRSYWEAETVEELYAEVLGGEREPPSKRAARVGVKLPPEFDVWFAQCVCPNPDGRFARASGAIAALAHALGIGPVQTPMPSPMVSEKIVPERRDDPSTEIMTARATVNVPPPRAPLAEQADTTSPASTPSVAPPPPRKGRRDRTTLAYAAGAVGVVIVVSGAVLALRGAGDREDSGKPAPIVASVSSIEPSAGSGLAESKPPVAAGSFSKRIEDSNPWIDTPRLSMQRHEVTRGEYASFLVTLGDKERASFRPLRDWPSDALGDGTEKHPVVWVTQPRAARFCDAIDARLPSSDEWRSGLAAKRYPWGNAFPPPGPVAFGQPSTAQLANVESSAGDRTTQGIFDLFGSVREWTEADAGFAFVQGVELDTPASEATTLFATPAQKLVDEGDDPVAHATEVAGPFIGFRCVRSLD
jgi:serine/threonine protein kinase